MSLTLSLEGHCYQIRLVLNDTVQLASGLACNQVKVRLPEVNVKRSCASGYIIVEPILLGRRSCVGCSLAFVIRRRLRASMHAEIPLVS